MNVETLMETLEIAIAEGVIDKSAEVRVTYQPSHPLVATFDGIHVDSKGTVHLVAGRDVGYSDGEAYEEDGLVNEALCR